MPRWNDAYVAKLAERLASLTDSLDSRIGDIAAGRTAPALDDITLGSGRRVRAGVMFFDIREFSRRTSRPDVDALADTLYMLDCVIPMVMQVVFDHGGYVEKNTGDGVMAIIGVGEDDEKIADTTLDVATISFFVLKELINPRLSDEDLDEVSARIGIDMGTLLLARIGSPKGNSRHDRSHLTAVGPSANLASKLQQRAGTNEIWTGDLIWARSSQWRGEFFHKRSPPGWDWKWVGGDWEGQTYDIWHYDAYRKWPS